MFCSNGSGVSLTLIVGAKYVEWNADKRKEWLAIKVKGYLRWEAELYQCERVVKATD